VRQLSHKSVSAWKTWAEDNGHLKSTKQVFGRDLRAVVPGLRVARVGGHESVDRQRVYQGVTIRRDIEGAWEDREALKRSAPSRATADAPDADMSVEEIADAVFAHPNHASAASAVARTASAVAADASVSEAAHDVGPCPRHTRDDPRSWCKDCLAAGWVDVAVEAK
jgi:hypothetical protein